MILQKLTSENFRDFESLFAGCAQCRDCWCLNHRVKPQDVVTGDAAKSKMKTMVAGGEVGGLLGYADGKCVAWISVDPVNSQVGHDFVLEKGAMGLEDVWTIHCVYIAPEYRGKGLSAELIKSAIAFAKERGAKKVMAFPIPAASRENFPANDAEFSGRHSSFKKAGFTDQDTLGSFYQIMEKQL